ncbi:MAG: Fic family protein [Ilumatobacter sp.]|nr:Fic family protein [Ilumatobacter sp.]
MIVPALPPPDPALVDAHAAAHADLTAALHAAAPEVRRVFVHLQRRLTVEALAHVQPIEPGDATQALFPPPRAFLTAGQRRRLEGADAAFRHLDSRIAMHRMGAIPAVLDATTPLVLHALVEGPAPSGVETNAGLYRATPTSWHAEVNPFAHRAAGEVAGLAGAAVAMALDAPMPAIARAGWLAFTLLCIHPFVDGNGRVARALFLATTADETPEGIDWGVLECWARARGGYVAALQAGQRCGGYDPLRLDPSPFMDFAVRTSTEGARTCQRRLEALAALRDQPSARGLHPAAAAVLLAVAVDRGAVRDELAGLGPDGPELRTVVNELLAEGHLTWAERPASRRVPGGPVVQMVPARVHLGDR